VAKSKKPKRKHVLDRAIIRVPVELLMRWCAFWLTVFGPRWAYWWARRAASLAWGLMPKLRGISLRNVDLCFPEKSEAERTRIARLGFRHAVYQFVDYLLVPRYFTPRQSSSVYTGYPPEHPFRAWFKEDKPGFNLTAHIGNFEIATFAIGEDPDHITPILIAKPVRPPLLDHWLTRARIALGNDVVHSNEGARGYLRVIKERRKCGTLIDQNGGDFAPVETFFGVPCTWQADFARILLRGGGNLYYHFCIRDGDKFAFRNLEPELHTYAADADPMQVMRDYRDAVERVVRQHPEQYLWMHRRFKARKKGWPDRYANLRRRLTPDQRAAMLNVPGFTPQVDNGVDGPRN
jgi:KDO2-lipid IV(A) lauroyltransferase